MIIKLKGADFSTNNINTLLTNWFISVSLGSGADSSNTATSVAKGAAYNNTITIADGYEIGSAGVTVTMGGTAITPTISGNTITISIAAVTGNVVIKVPTKVVGGGEEEPDTTNYTFTINPTPSTATVTLTASGYTQSGNSITVASGTTVNWTVSADGYATQTGTWTANGSNKTENVVLIVSGGEDEDNILSGITMVHGNAFLASPTSDTNRASSSINFYADGNKTISLKDPTNYEYALYTCTDETTQAGGTGSGWIIDTRSYYNKWIGVCLKKKDGSNFDFSTESNLLSNYITVE